MKGTEKIIAHIRGDAKTQAEEILRRADQQCAQLRQEADQQAAQAYADRIRAGVKSCEDQADSARRITRMEGRKSLLALKQELVGESFRRAQAQIVSMPREEYVAFLAGLAAQAAVTGDEQIILNARDRKAIGPELVKAANARLDGGRLSLAEETRDFAGGLILRRGSVEANCTVELLVELSRNELSARVAELLFA